VRISSTRARKSWPHVLSLEGRGDKKALRPPSPSPRLRGEGRGEGRLHTPTVVLLSVPSKRKSRALINPHPGDILMEELLKPMALSQTALAKAIKVPPRRVNEIVLGKRAITADTDLRLARYFGMSEGFFLQLQTDHDLLSRRRQIADQLKAIRPRAA
jgi:addiction module HigA family antidote